MFLFIYLFVDSEVLGELEPVMGGSSKQHPYKENIPVHILNSTAAAQMQLNGLIR